MVIVCAEDPQLAEFLRLMQPRRAGNLWSNEDATLATPAPGKGQKAKTGVGAGVVGDTAHGDAAEKPGRRRQHAAQDSAHNGAVPMQLADLDPLLSFCPGKETKEASCLSRARCIQHGPTHPLVCLPGAVEGPDDSEEEEEEEEAPEDFKGAQQKDAVVVDAAVSDMDYLRARMTMKVASDEEEDAEEAVDDEPESGEEEEEEAEDEGADAGSEGYTHVAVKLSHDCIVSRKVPCVS